MDKDIKSEEIKEEVIKKEDKLFEEKNNAQKKSDEEVKNSSNDKKADEIKDSPEDTQKPEKSKKRQQKKTDPDEFWHPKDSNFAPGKNKNKQKAEDDLDSFNPFKTNSNKSDREPGKGRNRIGMMLFAIIAALLVFSFVNQRSSAQEVTYTNFKNLVIAGKIGSVNIKNNRDILFNQGDLLYKTRIPYNDSSLLSFLEKNTVEVRGSDADISILSIFLELLPWIIFIGFYVFIFKNMSAGGQMMQYGKSHAKQFSDKEVKVKFKDVAGQKEAKYELEEVVDFLKNPKKYSEIGAKIPRGVLLVGPPGTGKTLIAKAVAGEAGVSFFHTSGSDFVEMFVGMGAARVRDLFDHGRKNAPCILFIDEIDAVGRARGSGLGGGHDEREQTLNQILVEMDGFDTKSGVIVIAATNRADVLDPALLRPGRFDRQVAITLPDIDEREEILKIHAAKVKMEESVDLRRIARATPGASGADLANLVNEAALFATREKRNKVGMPDFEMARDKMVLGVAKKSHVMTPEDKRLTAYHEAGHALLFYYLPDIDPLYKVTIIPHGNAGGVTMGLPERDNSYLKKSSILSHIKMAMGGYVAENIINGQTSTGPSADIKQATELARRMVTEWGMSDKLGFISLGSEGEPLFLGREIAKHKDFSENTAKEIDTEIRTILTSCMKETTRILTENRDKLDKLAEELIARETLDDREVRALLGFEEIGQKNSDLS